MPDLIPPVPPSVEQNVHEVRAWMTNTRAGRTLTETGVHAQLAASMAGHFPEMGVRTLGEVLVRLASHMGATIAVEPDIPVWMLMNLVAMAGVDLIEEGDDDDA